MVFNGVRKHKKVEDPRFLYHADHMGFLVWGEIGTSYAYSRSLASAMTVIQKLILRKFEKLLVGNDRLLGKLKQSVCKADTLKG